LGHALQASDDDVLAARAFEQAIAQNPQRLEAWMALAVTRTNQGLWAEAHTCLLAVDDAPPSYQSRHNLIIANFMGAARSAYHAGEYDPDLQVALGVLFNISQEYAKAADCFQTVVTHATSAEPMSWSRLGASHANAGRHAEAVDAYRRAIAISPRNARARYNLALSLIRNPSSSSSSSGAVGALRVPEHTWATLRGYCAGPLERPDLVALCDR
ncbi:hypothetical protein CXG81DRAFT_4400, partial [Caulochytrium protostelioides]